MAARCESRNRQSSGSSGDLQQLNTLAGRAGRPGANSGEVVRLAAYRIYTVEAGRVTEGARVDRFTLPGAETTIPAVLVGERGRGRELGVLPVQLFTDEQAVWAERGGVVILTAEIAQTRSGRPKLISRLQPFAGDNVLVVLRTPIGFRGGNSHTGDRKGAERVEDPPEFLPFPGKILVRGVISQGIAGGMGSGEQLVALIPKGVVFRTAYSGRLYGRPAAHYYLWTGERLLAATWEERQLAELF